VSRSFPAVASLWLSRRALLADVPAGWEGLLARAAVILSLTGLLYGALTMLGGFIHQY
jgi:hypothetical protein